MVLVIGVQAAGDYMSAVVIVDERTGGWCSGSQF